jgi:phosphate transport system substrate-binding protein
VALDALAVYVHKENPMDSISLGELAEIYGEDGSITKWSQLEGWSSDAP